MPNTLLLSEMSYRCSFQVPIAEKTSARLRVLPLALVGNTCGPVDSAESSVSLSADVERELDVVDSAVVALEVVELVVELLDERVKVDDDFDDDVPDALVDATDDGEEAGVDATVEVADIEPAEQAVLIAVIPAIKRINAARPTLEVPRAIALSRHNADVDVIRSPIWRIIRHAAMVKRPPARPHD
jgi:hypothetical protein